MKRMRRALSRFRRSQSGATAIEYALIAALISTSLITGAQVLSERVGKNFKCADNVMSERFRDDGRGPCAPFERTAPPAR